MAGRGRWLALGLTALVAVATGCGSEATVGDSAPVTTTAGSAPMSTTTPGGSQPTEPTRTFTTVPPPASAVVAPSLQPAVDVAVDDLAAHLGVDASAIVTVSARDVTWPDGSIGCPQPGMMYTQVQVDGAEIILQSSGSTYRYTSGGGRGPTLCENA